VSRPVTLPATTSATMPTTMPTTMSATTPTSTSPSTPAPGAVEHYVEEFGAVYDRLPGAGVAWLRDKRRGALECFRGLGFPGPRDEHWKYTRVAPIEQRPFRATFKPCLGLTEDDVEQFFLPGVECHRLVFVNGLYTSQLSAPGEAPEGVTLESLAAALASAPDALEPHLARQAPIDFNAFTALNTAFMGDGAALRIAAGVTVDKPVHLVFLATPQEQESFAHPRNLIVAGEDSRVTVVESYVSLGQSAYLTNTTTEIDVGAGARVTHCKLQQESTKGFHVANIHARQDRASRLDSCQVSLGAALARTDLNVSLEAEGAECALDGLYVAGGRQHVDYHTRIDHAQPGGTSRERYKGILSGRGRGVFNGRIYVHPDAQRSDAEMSNDNLLLSRDAEIDTKPQLEIFADDVKCAHGATVGQLDETAVYYLRSRGIDEGSARALLTYGFARDPVDRIPVAALRGVVETLLIGRLPQAEFIRGLVE